MFDVLNCYELDFFSNIFIHIHKTYWRCLPHIPLPALSTLPPTHNSHVCLPCFVIHWAWQLSVWSQAWYRLGAIHWSLEGSSPCQYLAFTSLTFSHQLSIGLNYILWRVISNLHNCVILWEAIVLPWNVCFSGHSIQVALFCLQFWWLKPTVLHMLGKWCVIELCSQACLMFSTEHIFCVCVFLIPKIQILSESLFLCYCLIVHLWVITMFGT